MSGLLAIRGLYKCAVCGGDLLEYSEGEFRRYYCGECDIPYYVYEPKPEAYWRSLVGVERSLGDDFEEDCFLGQATVFSLILIAILELIYHVFFI